MKVEQEQKPLKLHLGCGDKYLEGYVNIDFPPSEHTVMHPKVDRVADIRTLNFPDGSVDEIRSHHMFEHFTRPVALGLLLTWRRWLKPGGVLVVETPDFGVSALAYCLTFSLRRSFQLWRHILGSQEAGWAYHGDYWDKRKYRFVLRKTGYGNVTIRSYWHGLAKHARQLPGLGPFFSRVPEPLYLPFVNILGLLVPDSFYAKRGGNAMPNILAIAKKDPAHVEEEKAVREILSMSLVGREGDAMLNVWLDEYKKFKKDLASNS
jgi:SAM-dependent methyltransferase